MLTRLWPVNLSLTAPHRVFTGELSTLADAEDANAAFVHTAWRMLVEEAGEVYAAAECHGFPQAPDSSVTTELNRGPFVQATASVIAEMEGHPQFRDADYELRLLRVPALYLVALWLHGEDGGYSVPLPPAPTPFEARRPYDIDVFMGHVREEARKMLDFYSRSDEPDLLGG
jgi:hypothetical protein